MSAPPSPDSGAYLDHAATTPMRPEAVEAMLPFFSERFGNPSGSHATARDARLALDEAREVVAASLGASPGEVVFTAGGTEADNLAVGGVHGRRGGTVVCSTIEHRAVLNATAAAGGRTVGVTPDGLVDLEALAGELRAGGVTLVSLMLANNEVGTVQPLAAAAALVAEHAPGALVHTDAVQAFPWLDVASAASPADFVAISAHKFGGPKGVGALVVRGGARDSVSPIVRGGSQERNLRPGTHNVPAIVGMAAAAAATVAERTETVERVRRLRDRLADGLLAGVTGLVETAPRASRIAGNCHVSIKGVDAEELLMVLDRAGIAASAGSACASGAIEPSHVLLAMGLPTSEARTGIRFSLGRTTTEAEVDETLAAVIDAVSLLRE